MKRLLALLLLLTLSTASFAQYNPLEETTPGASLYNTGKGLIWTGAGIALSSMALSVFSVGDSYNYLPYSRNLALGGFGAGACISLVGSILMLTGNNQMLQSGIEPGPSGSYLVSVSPQGQRGPGVLVEVGGGLGPSLEVRGIGGYHFNSHVFLGGGVGYIENFYSIPEGFMTAFFDSRFSLSNKKVSPYVGFDLGVSLSTARDKGLGSYAGIQAGTRSRSQSSRSWWLSAFTESAGGDAVTYGLKVGHSF